jgi:hypothetical protein
VKIARAHWQRVTWFRVHASHGALVLSKTWFSPGWEVVCPCGDKVSMHEELVPTEIARRSEAWVKRNGLP